MLTVILGRFYSQEEVGYFNQANKWTSMGYSTILGTINGIAQPVLRNVSEDTERQCRVFRKMLRFTAFISFPALFGLSLIAPRTHHNNHYRQMERKCNHHADSLYRKCFFFPFRIFIPTL